MNKKSKKASDTPKWVKVGETCMFVDKPATKFIILEATATSVRIAYDENPTFVVGWVPLSKVYR